LRTIRYDASARRFPAGRSPGFHAVAATSATAGSKAVDQNDGSRGDERGAGSEFASAIRTAPLVLIAMNAGYLGAIETINESARIKF
jgi:hypothetical protein